MPSIKKVIYQNSAIKKEMFIESQNLGHLIGKAKSNLNRLKDVYDVEITLPIKGSSQEIITIKGLAKDVYAAKTEKS